MGDFTTAYSFAGQGISVISIIDYVLALASAARSIAVLGLARRYVVRAVASSEGAKALSQLIGMLVLATLPIVPQIFLVAQDSRPLIGCALLAVSAYALVLWRIWRAGLLNTLLRQSQAAKEARLPHEGAFLAAMFFWTLFGLLAGAYRYGTIDRPYAELLGRYQRHEYLVAEGCIQGVEPYRRAKPPYDIVAVGGVEFVIKNDTTYPAFDLTDYDYITPREDIYVRILYVLYPGLDRVVPSKTQNVILRIDTRPTSCPLVGPPP